MNVAENDNTGQNYSGKWIEKQQYTVSGHFDSVTLIIEMGTNISKGW